MRLSFECDILEITFAGETRTENFDFHHNELVAAAKKLFPKDDKIRALEKEDAQGKRKEFEEHLKRSMSE